MDFKELVDNFTTEDDANHEHWRDDDLGFMGYDPELDDEYKD